MIFSKAIIENSLNIVSLIVGVKQNLITEILSHLFAGILVTRKFLLCAKRRPKAFAFNLKVYIVSYNAKIIICIISAFDRFILFSYLCACLVLETKKYAARKSFV